MFLAIALLAASKAQYVWEDAGGAQYAPSDRVRERSGVSMRKLLASTLQRQLQEERGRARARRDTAFVAVFSFGKDAQRGKVWTPDDANHIWNWKQSVEDLGMKGTVLHDDVFSPTFVQQEHGAVQFVHMNAGDQGLYTNEDLMELTTSDWRFIALHDYLKKHKDESDYVLLTDGADVAFRSDPFRYMRGVDDAMGHAYVYGGEEWRPWVSLNLTNDQQESAFSRLKPYWRNCFNTEMPELYASGRMPNCGILGGHVSVVMPFLERMRHWYAQVPPSQRFMMCDMLVYFRTIMEDYQDRFVSGYPFHAKFKDYDPRDVAAIYHKHPIPPPAGDPRTPQWRARELRAEPMALYEDLPSADGPAWMEVPGSLPE